ncbi:SDR family NAD(P)-dependent oxidoreductase [Novosphingobium sp. FKTRR1]|uniref:SDR family NAD(P)-dependent oxidoreductase n=1 Tax=Novosphingobium sp. FKTRR1 TaxID=2879118 RepID=UPI001CF02C49|nr:SDR family oxidoreductase [Novosphingobium sp. FKTRR1]
MMFKGKVALVTGGGSGIGAMAAQRLAAEGAQVAVVDINLAGAQAIAARIEASGGVAIALAADVSQAADNAQAFDAAAQAFGGLDVAFLNAGVLQPYVPFDAVTEDVFDRLVAINLKGAFLGLQQAHRHLRAGGAAVVTASAAAVIGFADAAAYSASKHGVLGLVRSAARDFSKKGLRVNAICPGGVSTPLIGASPSLDIVSPGQLALPPYQGLLDPQQVAEVALFLLSPSAVGVNGQAQLVDAALLSAFPEGSV